MIKIDDGIPVPVVRKRGPLTKWPFADLQIGQSFASHKKKPSEASLRTQAYSAGTGPKVHRRHGDRGQPPGYSSLED